MALGVPLPPNGCQNREVMWEGSDLQTSSRGALRVVVHMPFDKPTDADLEEPDRMWLDQLSGRRNFDPSSFMSFINDLLQFEREDWRGLFADLTNGAGFVTKLSDFFARHRGGLTGPNCSYPYFHPLQRNALEQNRLIEFAQRHVAELARIAGLAGAHEL